MASWSELEGVAPDLAATVRSRFEATGLGLLATLRKDGSPRISGIEPTFSRGELWLGMMDGSLKALDLRRDARLALHNATEDKNVKDGDARISGTAVELFDGDEARQMFIDHLTAQGNTAVGGQFHLFRVDVTELMMLRPAGDHLVIESWHPGRGVRSVDRY